MNETATMKNKDELNILKTNFYFSKNCNLVPTSNVDLFILFLRFFLSRGNGDCGYVIM